VPQDQIQLNAFPLVFGGRSIYGSLAGTAIDTEDALAFSVLENIRPLIEIVPLEQAADAYARQGKARFRHGPDHKGRTRAKCADQLSTDSLSGFVCRGHGRPVSASIRLVVKGLLKWANRHVMNTFPPAESPVTTQSRSDMMKENRPMALRSNRNKSPSRRSKEQLVIF
jgi:hypothetical protein